MSTVDLARVLRLPVAERLELLGQIWESLAADGAMPDLSPSQLAEADRRLDRFERTGPQGTPWVEARRDIERAEPQA